MSPNKRCEDPDGHIRAFIDGKEVGIVTEIKCEPDRVPAVVRARQEQFYEALCNAKKTTDDFNTALRKVTAITEMTSKQMQDLYGPLRNVARRFRYEKKFGRRGNAPGRKKNKHGRIGVR